MGNATEIERSNLDSDMRVPLECSSLCTFCREGRGALLDSVELQQQTIQLRQVVAHRRVHGTS